MRRLLLPLAAALIVTGCDVQFSSERYTADGAAPRETARVRVCRAATSALHPGEPTGARTVAVDAADAVRLVYEADPGGVGVTVECAFQGDQVTWRLLSVSVPTAAVTAAAQRPPETATYAVEGDTVRLRVRRPDGTSTESTWTSTETGGSVNFNATTKAE